MTINNRARKKTPEETGPAAELRKAIEFIKPIQKKKGTIDLKHCLINNGWAVACDGVITMGTKVSDDISGCPQTTLLADALKFVGDDLAITTTNRTMYITSGDYRAAIPCVEFDELLISAADENIAEVDNKVKEALKGLRYLTVKNSGIAHYTAVLLQPSTAVSTNGHIILEYWHGWDLPQNMLIPKDAAKIIGNIKKDLVGFGYSGPTATFWFEDGSFVKTRLFGERYPEYEHIFKTKTNDFEVIPEGFFEAIKKVLLASETNAIYFKDGKITSNYSVENEASTFKFDKLPETSGYNGEYLLKLQKLMHKACFETEPSKCYFFSEDNVVRGAIMGLSVDDRPQIRRHEDAPDDIDFDSDVPF